MTIQTKIHSAESGHWYQLDGTPAYTVKGKNGKERNTTLADARKLGLVPSVTTVLQAAAKPQLEAWKLTQLLKAQVRLPRIDGETQDEYAQRLIAASKEETISAADIGTEIHADVERLFLGEEPHRFADTALAVQALLYRHTGLREGWIAEASFACDLGYGGRIDLYHPAGWIVDVKSKSFTDPTSVRAFDDHGMQLAAYRKGIPLDGAKLMNVFVSREVPGLVTFREWEEGESSRHWNMFASLLKYWQLAKDYDPAGGAA